MSRPIVTLTTDFGAEDSYVGALKGVILGLNPRVTIVDVTHQVPPRDIAHAAFVLGSVYRYFPSDTVHVCVVDPGVGTSRRALLFETPAGRFIGPDNGTITYVVGDYGEAAMGEPGGNTPERGFLEPASAPVPERCGAYVLNRRRLWMQPVSDTFHGRDIFAPVAAHLSGGMSAAEAGDPISEIVCLSVPAPTQRDGAIEGRVIYVDHYGNLVTSVRIERLPGPVVEVEIGGRRIGGLSRSYAGGAELLALAGSHGYLEVAARNGRVADELGLGVGARLTVLVS